LTARARPASPIIAAREGSRSSAFSASPSAAGSPGGTSSPVSPSATTSGMPPTREATTAVPQAIASRLTMPSGSYTDGQANTVARASSWMISGLGSISGIQNTPVRDACSPDTSDDTSSSSSGVSAAPAHSTSCAAGSSMALARSSTGTPFCLVIRPTKITYGRPGSMPCLDSTPVSSSGAYSAVSIPLWITRIRSGKISG
jgi:hypothetical protein